MTPRVNLADLVTRRVPLVPREAATLTLAVAREWDRQRALHGPIALPPVAAIELTDAGTIVFLLLPPEGGDDEAAALSELLGCLLGTHHAEPRQSIPGGLLIMMSGRLGSMDLPSTPEGFREALARFADDTPTALRAVYWRGVTARSRESRSARKVTDGVRRPERRATAEQVIELHRCIRQFEQHAFEQERKTPWRDRMIRMAMAAALIALGVGGGVVATRFQPSPTRAVDARPAPSRPPESPAVNVARAQPAAPPSVRRRDATARVRRAPVRLPVARETHARPELRQPPVTHAGGTRGIAWLGR